MNSSADTTTRALGFRFIRTFVQERWEVRPDLLSLETRVLVGGDDASLECCQMTVHNPPGDPLAQPPASLGNEATTTAPCAMAGAAPTATTPPTTTTTAGAEDDDEGAAPAAEPEAAAEPLASPGGPPFLPPLPPDHATEPEAVEEPPDHRKDPGANLSGFLPVPVNQLLDNAYADCPHHNDGHHLESGVEGDAALQRRWRPIVDLATTHYSVPSGKVGRRFINVLPKELWGVQARTTWNSVRPLVPGRLYGPGRWHRDEGGAEPPWLAPHRG
jgi:hypothetical protein